MPPESAHLLRRSLVELAGYTSPLRGSNTLNVEKVNTNMFVEAVLFNFYLAGYTSPLEGAHHFIIRE